MNKFNLKDIVTTATGNNKGVITAIKKLEWNLGNTVAYQYELNRNGYYWMEDSLKIDVTYSRSDLHKQLKENMLAKQKLRGE